MSLSITSCSPNPARPFEKCAIVGNDFTPSTTVKFGSINAFSVTYSSPTLIYACPFVADTATVTVTDSGVTAAPIPFTLYEYPTSALEFGAVGDGVNDDGTALAAFFAYLSTGNKVGIIPRTDSFYYTTSQLELTGNNVVLFIDGDITADFTTLHPPGTVDPGYSLIYVHDCANVRVLGTGNTIDLQGQYLGWTYAPSGTTPGTNTILFKNVTYGYIENIIVKNGLVDCVKMLHCSYPTVSNVAVYDSVTDNGISIVQDPTTDPTDSTMYANGLVVNCKAFNCRDFGITSYQARNTRIINCECWHCGTDEAPEAPTLTSATGGSLAAGTYYYVISFINFNGIESDFSEEGSVVITSSMSLVNVSWPSVSDAYSYNIYRGTISGGENVVYTSLTNSFTDIGGTATTGKLPVPTGGGFSDEDNQTSDTAIPMGTIFDNCKVTDCVTNGIFSSSGKVRINNVVINGITCSYAGADNYIGHGISLLGNGDFEVSNCDVRNVAKIGISAVEETYSSSLIFHVAGLITNNYINNCGMGGVYAQGSTFINVADNVLYNTNTKSTPLVTDTAEITVLNPAETMDLAIFGTSIIRGNRITLVASEVVSSDRSVKIVNIGSVLIEDNSIEGHQSAHIPIRVNSLKALSSGTGVVATINGNSMQNSISPPMYIGETYKLSPGDISYVYVMGNTGDFTSTTASVDLSYADASVNDYDNRYAPNSALSSYALISSLSSYAPLAGPVFTGSPKVPTASSGTNNQQIANTQFVKTALNLAPNTVATGASNYTMALSNGNLVILPNITASTNLQATFPPVTDGLIMTVWVTNTSAHSWLVTTTVNVFDASGTAISSLSNSTVYRFFGYAALSAWIKMS